MAVFRNGATLVLPESLGIAPNLSVVRYPSLELVCSKKVLNREVLHAQWPWLVFLQSQLRIQTGFYWILYSARIASAALTLAARYTGQALAVILAVSSTSPARTNGVAL